MDTIALTSGHYIVSVCSVDEYGVESLFSRELMQATGVENVLPSGQKITLLQNKPNPSDEATTIAVEVDDKVDYKEAYISIADLNGKEIQRQNIVLDKGVNEIMYNHGYHASGTYVYTLVVDGKAVASKKMMFTN